MSATTAFNPLFYGFDWIAKELRGDATITSLATAGVWRTDVPRDDAQRILKYPAVVIISQGSPVVKVIGDEAIMWYADYFVKVVNVQRDGATTNQIANRIVTLLHQSSGSVNGADILRCEMNQSIHESEPFQGDRFDHLGTYFTLTMQPS